MKNIQTLKTILTTIEESGGEIFVVGGPVRDKILGKEPKDIDFLVRKLTLAQIANAIRSIGKADEVGRAFGVVKGDIDGDVYDFAIPRTKEVKTGTSHTDFAVETDPMASVEGDMQRRDFTINSMAIALRDFISGDMSKVIDPNGGMADLKAGVLRAVEDPAARFAEDPLRILRGLQFSVRIGFKMDMDTMQAINNMADKLKTVSGERILEEFKKAWTKGEADSKRFVTLLKWTRIGTVLFGNDFNPIPAMLKKLNGEEKVMGMMTAFFINGGKVSVMKPEAIQVKFLEVAKKVAFGKDSPHTFIGTLKPLLPVMLEVMREVHPESEAKVQRMIDVAITPKELAVSGEELMATLGITNPKDGKRIGETQRAMLTAIWTDKLENEKTKLIDFISNAS